jgi:hypothetical protein
MAGIPHCGQRRLYIAEIGKPGDMENPRSPSLLLEAKVLLLLLLPHLLILLHKIGTLVDGDQVVQKAQHVLDRETSKESGEQGFLTEFLAWMPRASALIPAHI